MKHASLLAETGRCVACGLCLPHCPTYRKTQSEADSPRGRILLTQAVAQGTLPASARYIEHMELCLTCRACESVCPNQVRYGAIADEARALIHGENHRQPALLRLALRVVCSPRLLRSGAALLRLAQRLRLSRLFPALPRVSRSYRWKSRYGTQQKDTTREVCLFLGCATDALDAETLAASVFVLERLGYAVHVPPAQTCCGGLHRQAGDSATAEAMDNRNRSVFAAFGTMPILTTASGCGARLIEAMPGRVHDINAFLADATGWQGVTIAPLAARIAVQEPCTLRNALKARGVQQKLLQHIPDAEIVSLPGNAQCCGGAGSYMLTQPDMARSLRADKLAACSEVAPDYLATANIGCALHIAQGLAKAHQPVQVVHPVTLLARQMGFNGELQ